MSSFERIHCNCMGYNTCFLLGLSNGMTGCCRSLPYGLFTVRKGSFSASVLTLLLMPTVVEILAKVSCKLLKVDHFRCISWFNIISNKSYRMFIKYYTKDFYLSITERSSLVAFLFAKDFVF